MRRYGLALPRSNVLAVGPSPTFYSANMKTTAGIPLHPPRTWTPLTPCPLVQLLPYLRLLSCLLRFVGRIVAIACQHARQQIIRLTKGTCTLYVPESRITEAGRAGTIHSNPSMVSDMMAPNSGLAQRLMTGTFSIILAAMAPGSRRLWIP